MTSGTKWGKLHTRQAGLAALIAICAVLLLPFEWKAAAQESVCQLPFQSVSLPLTDLGPDEYVRMDGQVTGFSGGLYPDGSNERPAAHEAAGMELASQIEPLDPLGNPDPSEGHIVLISIGMSNTQSEFDRFIQQAHEDEQINPRLFIVNGAMPMQVSDRWTDPQAIGWVELENEINQYGLSNLQVQAAWVKLTQTEGGEFPAKAQALQADLEIIMANLHAAYPNLKLVYLSSRTHSYVIGNGLSPEPVAFETGFAVKWLIEKQINGDASLNYDPEKGEVQVPYLSWGPYLWANGEIPRSDGLTWTQADLVDDCTHPSESGKDKVAQMLLDFFKNDSTAQGWFVGGDETEPHVIALPEIAAGGLQPAATAAPANRVTTTATASSSPAGGTTVAEEGDNKTATPTQMAGQIPAKPEQDTGPTPIPFVAGVGAAAVLGTGLWMIMRRK